MSGKKPRNLKRENEIRRRDTAQRRSGKVILGYIKAVHPKIYNEGSKYFDKLNEAHPQKKDLTRTKEYKAMIKNNTGLMNDFELRIELMSTKIQTTTMTATVALEPCQETPQPNTTCQDHPEPCQETPQPNTTCQDHPEPCQETPQPNTMCQDLLPLGEEEMEALLDDLRQDSNIADFFANIDYELDTCPLW